MIMVIQCLIYLRDKQNSQWTIKIIIITIPYPRYAVT
jgi:hypothetical protein